MLVFKNQSQWVANVEICDRFLNIEYIYIINKSIAKSLQISTFATDLFNTKEIVRLRKLAANLRICDRFLNIEKLCLMKNQSQNRSQIFKFATNLFNKQEILCFRISVVKSVANSNQFCIIEAILRPILLSKNRSQIQTLKLKIS